MAQVQGARDNYVDDGDTAMIDASAVTEVQIATATEQAWDREFRLQSESYKVCETLPLDLIRRRAMVNGWSQDAFGKGLWGAAQSGRIDVASYLLSRGAKFDSMSYGIGATSNSTEFMQFMLDNGWNINHKLENGQGHILEVVVHDERQVRWCIERGALPPTDPWVSRCVVITRGPILDAAAQRGSPAVFKLLYECGAPLGRPIQCAALAYKNDPSREAMLEYLINGLGVDINEIPDQEYAKLRPEYTYTGTALETAARRRNIEAVQLLLKHGADKRKRNDYGKTALDFARLGGDPACIALLS